MNTTAPPFTHAPPQSATPPRFASRPPGSASPGRPTWGELLAQTGPLIGAPAFFGPPVIYVLGPWFSEFADFSSVVPCGVPPLIDSAS